MNRKARAYSVLIVLAVLFASSRPAVRPARAFFGLDPASWIVVGQMASVVSNLMAMRDTMMRIRDEALNSYRGLVDPLDDFAGQMRRALGEGGALDFSAFQGADPRRLEMPECSAVPPDEEGAVPCTPDGFPPENGVFAGLGTLAPDVVQSLGEGHAVRAAAFEMQLAEAGHRELLVEEARVAIGLYLGCELDQDAADRRGVIVCPTSRTWTAAEREGLRNRLIDAVNDLSTQDCPAAGAGGAGQGRCASLAQHRSLLVAASQAQANLQALLLKLDAEDADRGRREFERELAAEAREEQARLDRLRFLAELDLSLDTAEGRANVLPGPLHARNPDARPFGGGLFVH